MRPETDRSALSETSVVSPPTSLDSRVDVVVALLGQPNTGKSTIFNQLTGLHQHVGNWPGKTIEKKTGTVQHDGISIQLVDLPGTYSLTANSVEERVSRDFILGARPQVIMLVTDASALERNLYLLAELLALPVPVVLGLNMMDIVEQEGLRIDVAALADALGMPVVPLVARRNEGSTELLDAVVAVIRDPSSFHPNRPRVTGPHEVVLARIAGTLADHIPPSYPPDWTALKLLEGDREVTERARDWLEQPRWEEVHEQLRAHEDAILDIAGARYAWIEQVARGAIARPRTTAIHLTERLDRIAAHPLLGMAMLLGIFGFVYWLTFTLATPAQDWLEVNVVGRIADWIESQSAFLPEDVIALLTDGLLGGAGTVLTFMPLLIVFFVALGFLEDTGYLARGAYVMDRFMHVMGLHGKSVLPLVLGFGCNVPAIMGTRILESTPSRLLTIILAPFVPCAARFAVLAFLTPAFFGVWAPAVAVGLVSLNLVLLAALGVALNRIFFRGERAALIMELPLYHVPNLRTIALFTWNNVMEFLRKAGTIIVAVSLVIWALSTYPGPGVENSILGAFGQLVAPLGQLMGLEWRLLVAVLASFPAKENAIATLGVLFGEGEEDAGLATVLQAQVSAASALSFLAVEMLFIPCMATVAVIRRETGTWRWTLFAIGITLAIAVLAGIAVYQIAVRVLE
jgi:ferrous iron transport protein B